MERAERRGDQTADPRGARKSSSDLHSTSESGPVLGWVMIEVKADEDDVDRGPHWIAGSRRGCRHLCQDAPSGRRIPQMVAWRGAIGRPSWSIPCAARAAAGNNGHMVVARLSVLVCLAMVACANEGA